MSENPAPSRIIVSLRSGLALAAANIVCAGIIAWAWMHIRQSDQTVQVTGSATVRIQSDLIVWRGTVTARADELAEAYRRLKESVAAAAEFVKARGVPPPELTIGAVRTTTQYERDANGRETPKITGYALSQTLGVTSADVARIEELSRSATELIEQDILFDSQAPEFMYTKLADLKIKMLAEATKDATLRAEQICTNSGSRLGALRSARMGVMQIAPAHSTEVSDYGMNDTSSFEKDVRAVVTATFAVK